LWCECEWCELVDEVEWWVPGRDKAWWSDEGPKRIFDDDDDDEGDAIEDDAE